MPPRSQSGAVWAGFAVVHAWLAYVGVVLAPAASFHDVDLYRWWMYLATAEGVWPVLDGPWVYPAGAIVPMLLPALGSATSSTAYAIGWCLLVTILDGVAVSGLLRRGRRGALAAAWWLAFLAALGPVAMGRLDGVIAPLMVLALLEALERPRLATALLTAGAWIKVAPAAVLLPVAVVVRRPVRAVVVPAAAVSLVVVVAVTAAGGLPHITSFLTTQTGRGLQIEAVAATPWILGHAVDGSGTVLRLNEALVTWELTAPAATTTARALDVVLALSVGAAAGLMWWAGRRGRSGRALLPGALLLLTLLVVVNKVGSPQYLSWLAPPVAAMLAARAPRGRRWLPAVSALLLVAAGLTQVVFPWGYMDLLTGELGVALALTARNALLVALVAMAVVGLVHAGRADALPEPDDDDAADDAVDPADPPGTADADRPASP